MASDATKISWGNHRQVLQRTHLTGWMHSHAQLPTPLELKDCVRIFFTSRTENNKSNISFVDVAKGDVSQVNYAHDTPLLTHGAADEFDHDGIMPGALVQRDDALWLYYLGWNCQSDAPYRINIGVAESHDNGMTFTKRHGPLFNLDDLGTDIMTTPHVEQMDGVWHMWLSRGLPWVGGESAYEIWHGTSEDGIDWQLDTSPAIAAANGEALASPTVMHDGSGFHMWFSVRQVTDFRDGDGGYRMGYAHSSDGIRWQRDDANSGFAPSGDAWDESMQCYPRFFALNGRRFLFYCGNDFGRDGFGYVEELAI